MADLRQRLEGRTRRNARGCREWTGARFPNGYGKITVGSLTDGTRGAVGVHRVAYREFVGPIPKGLCVLHTCDNRVCWEPSHLFVGTEGDNARDREQKGRGGDLRGEANGQARLTDVQVMAIRWLVAEGLKHAPVAQLFGIRRQLVSRIASGDRWAHLPVFPYTPQRGGARI